MHGDHEQNFYVEIVGSLVPEALDEPLRFAVESKGEAPLIDLLGGRHGSRHGLRFCQPESLWSMQTGASGRSQLVGGQAGCRCSRPRADLGTSARAKPTEDSNPPSWRMQARIDKMEAAGRDLALASLLGACQRDQVEARLSVAPVT
jgi:hypothetical protein